MGAWTLVCFCCLEVLFGVYVQTLIHGVMGSAHQVELCDTFIRLCKGIHFLLLPSSRVICRFQLLFLLGCFLDGGMEICSAV